MNRKLLNQIKRRVQTEACGAPSNSASLIRMQLKLGQRCRRCLGLLPPPHTPEVSYCTICRPGARRHTVYVSFVYRHPYGWYCRFLEWNLITPAGKSVFVRDEALLLEMARRGGGAPFAHSLPRIANGIRAGRGTFYLRLTDAQHKKLQHTLQAADAAVDHLPS